MKLSSTLKLRNFENGMKMMAVAPHHWYVQPILAFNISIGVGYCFIHSKGNAKTRVWDKAISSCTFFVLSAFIWELGSITNRIDMSWLSFKKGWTKEEKIAVLKSLCFIIGADEKVVNAEGQLLVNFFQKYGLDSTSAMYEQASMSQDKMSSIIRQFSNEDKNLVLGYWKQAVSCDGNIDPNEVTTLVLMAKECGINFTTLSFNPNV